MDLEPEEERAIAYLRTPVAIRERSENVLARGLEGHLRHFAVEPGELDSVCERVAAVTRRSYPDLKVAHHSRWSHFRAEGVDRVRQLDERIAAFDAEEQARTRFDLAVTSVFLDAGAGAAWRFREPGTGLELERSEGLAVASYHLFLGGTFSGRERQPLRADAAGLETLTEERLAEALQVSARNPLVGLDGRAALLRRLAGVLRGMPGIFGSEARIAGLYDTLRERAVDGALPAAAILGAVLEAFTGVWPPSTSVAGVGLGDVWPHRAAGGSGPGSGLVPFHKLSQWLSYSLIEPLEFAAVRVIELDALTALPEYRNGGLLIDMGVLRPKHDGVTGQAHSPAAEVIVEWRALTVALIDRVAGGVRQLLGLDREALPLSRVLEGGTWRAGREVARERRADGSPPISIVSDGTVF